GDELVVDRDRHAFGGLRETVPNVLLRQLRGIVADVPRLAKRRHRGVVERLSLSLLTCRHNTRTAGQVGERSLKTAQDAGARSLGRREVDAILGRKPVGFGLSNGIGSTEGIEDAAYRGADD